jgi:hypothetical protein
MRLNKAIVHARSYYIAFLSFLTLLNFLPVDKELKILFQTLLLVTIILPIVFLILKSSYKKIIILYSLFFIVLCGVIALSFRWIRDILPDTQLDTITSIGYAQYFGYPLHLDTIIFFIIIFSPVLFFAVIKVLKIKIK